MANKICKIIFNLDEIPDELLYLIFLKSSKAPSNPNETAIYIQNKIFKFDRSAQSNTEINKPIKMITLSLIHI